MKIIKNIKQEKLNKLDKIALDLCNIPGVYLAGGCFRKLVNDSDTILDYDFFFANPNAISDIKHKLENLGAQLIFSCPAGELFTYYLTIPKKWYKIFGNDRKIKIQLITKRFYSSLSELLSTFDFTVTCFGYDCKQFICHEKYVQHVKKKKLHINKLEYPVATLNRCYKYKDKGYFIGDVLKEIVELVWDRNENIIDYGLLYLD